MDLQRLATASRLANIDAFHVMELAKQAAELERAGRHIIHMGIGEPDFTAAAPVIHAAEAAMRRGVTQYTGALGIHALREAIAGYYKTSYGIDVPARRVIVTAGASGALLLACAVLVEIGAEVLMPDPSYPCNRHFVAAFDGHAKMIPSGPEERFQLTAAQVIEHWGENTRGVLLASPSNPTGTSILPDELKAILAEVRKRQGFAILDEIYQGLSYDAPPVSALSLDDNVVTVNSFSKYFNMTGWRLGWLVVPDSLVPAFERSRRTCSSARRPWPSTPRWPASRPRHWRSMTSARRNSAAAAMPSFPPSKHSVCACRSSQTARSTSTPTAATSIIPPPATPTV